MERVDTRTVVAILLVGVLLAGGAGCVVQQRSIKSSALDFLYPSGTEAVPPGDVTLKLPLRVGLAFAPPTSPASEGFSEMQKQALLDRVAAAFRDHESIRHVEVIPTSFLDRNGGFENLDKLVAAFGIDVMTLVSYDQFQFSESGKSSLAYWTLIGAYVVKGEKNETRTMLDAVVYDIPSRAMLFHASGQSSRSGKATPAELGKKLRLASEAGFDEATDDLIAELTVALERFADQAATGTVRGAGTPEVVMVDEQGQRVGQGGAGSIGLFGAVATMLLLAGALASRRRTIPRD